MPEEAPVTTTVAVSLGAGRGIPSSPSRRAGRATRNVCRATGLLARRDAARAPVDLPRTRAAGALPWPVPMDLKPRAPSNADEELFDADTPAIVSQLDDAGRLARIRGELDEGFRTLGHLGAAASI